MSRLGKFWTDAVAYIALTLGSGVSIAGNVADTYRTRGAATDGLDLFLAAFWPATVVLTVELFVNKRWVGLAWPMQVLRWAGCIAIGGMAMRVSWVHLNDLMASRGQKADVAILGPLAIDALAIMATALILAGRRGHVATMATAAPTVVDKIRERDMATVANWNGHVATDAMATDASPAIWPVSEEPATFFRPVPPDATASFVYETDEPDPVATRPQGDLDAWTAGYEDALAMAGQELVTEAEGYLSKGAPDLKVPAVPGTLPQRDPVSVPVEAQTYLAAWHAAGPDGPAAKEVELLLGAYFGKSARTVRRWRGAVLGPVSGPPNS